MELPTAQAAYNSAYSETVPCTETLRAAEFRPTMLFSRGRGRLSLSLTGSYPKTTLRYVCLDS